MMHHLERGGLAVCANSGDLLKTIVSVKAIKANQLFRVLTWQEEPWSAKPIDISWEGPVTLEAPREVYKGPHCGLCCGSDWAGSTEHFQGDCCSRVGCGPVTNSGKALSERFGGRSLLSKGRSGSTLLPKLRNVLHVLEAAHASSNGQNLTKSHFLAGFTPPLRTQCRRQGGFLMVPRNGGFFLALAVNMSRRFAHLYRSLGGSQWIILPATVQRWDMVLSASYTGLANPGTKAPLMLN